MVNLDTIKFGESGVMLGKKEPRQVRKDTGKPSGEKNHG